MAPGYRANTQTRRGNRSGYPEHDDFEGLPVRQWRQEWVTVAPAAQVEAQQENDIWARELPYGMPKDSQLLAPHSVELLRAARSGRLYKRPIPADDDDADPDAILDKSDKKDDASTKGYTVKVWKQVARNAEGPTISHLAKRRKNTITLKPKAEVLQATGASITRATVRRVDAAGNPYEQTITLTDGQAIDGEIISTSVVPMPVAEAVAPAQQATPMRRKPPPPRRKPKGPGRGRKKKLPMPASTRPPTSQEMAGGAAVATLLNSQIAGGASLQPPAPNGGLPQSESMDLSVAASDDEDGDDGDDGDEGDEGEGDVEIEGASDPNRPPEAAQNAKPSDDAQVAQPKDSVNVPDNKDFEISEEPPASSTLKVSASPPVVEGSALKQVSLPSPTKPSPRDDAALAEATDAKEDVEMTDGNEPVMAANDEPAKEPPVPSPKADTAPAPDVEMQDSPAPGAAEAPAPEASPDAPPVAESSVQPTADQPQSLAVQEPEKPEQGPEQESNKDPGQEPKQDLEQKPEQESEPGPQLKVQLEAEPEAQPEPEVRPEPEAQPQPEAKPDPEPSVLPELKPSPEPSDSAPAEPANQTPKEPITDAPTEPRVATPPSNEIPVPAEERQPAPDQPAEKPAEESTEPTVSTTPAPADQSPAVAAAGGPSPDAAPLADKTSQPAEEEAAPLPAQSPSPTPAPAKAAAGDGDGDAPDLFSGLEAQLDAQDEQNRAAVEAEAVSDQPPTTAVDVQEVTTTTTPPPPPPPPSPPLAADMVEPEPEKAVDPPPAS